MNPFNIRQPQDRRKVYNEYLANLQMQIDNLAKTESAVSALQTTGVAPVQPTDTRTLSEKLLDIDNQKKVLRQALLDITDGSEAGKIMKSISDEDVVFLGVAWGDFSKLIKQKFASGILAPLFNEVLQRYKKDYIASLSVQQTGSTEELLLSMREMMRLMPNADQLRELTYVIQQLPAGSVPSGMVSSALSATSTLSSLLPTQSMIEALDKMNPIDRAAAEKAINDGLSSITTGAVLQDLTQKLQQASPQQKPSILTTIINDIILTKHDADQLVQAKAIAELKATVVEAENVKKQGTTVKQKSTMIGQIKSKQEAREEFETMLAGPVGAEPRTDVEEYKKQQQVGKSMTQEQMDFVALVDDPLTTAEDIQKFSLLNLRQWVSFKISIGGLPKMTAVAKMDKPTLVEIIEQYKSGKIPASPPPKARKPSTKKATTPSTATATPFVVVEYNPDMSVAEFEELDYPDKRSVLEDMDSKRIMQDELSVDQYNSFKEIMRRNQFSDEDTYVLMYGDMRRRLGLSGKGLKGKKRITFGGSIASMKPLMTVRPDNIDLDKGIKRETSYMPLGKYVINKQKLRDNTLLMRTVKGGQIAELPQMTISSKLGKMLNKIIHGYGFPSHGDLSELDDSDKDIMYKVFKMSKAEGIESIPRPNKTKDEAEFNRFTILKGQILAGNNSKELIKEFKTLLVKLIHNDKILRKDGHAILLDLAALGF